MTEKKKTGRPPVKVVLATEDRERLEAVYRTSPVPRDREKAQVILLARDGTRSYARLGEIVMRSGQTVFNWIKLFCVGGVDALLGHDPIPGRPSAMNGKAVQDGMAEALRDGAWVTARQARAWLASEHGIALSLPGVRYWLGKAGGAHKVPRPVHVKRDAAAAADFEAHLFDKLRALGIPSGARARVWAADEARYGLHDRLRRCWGFRGWPTVKPRQQDYEWGYAFGALDVLGGASEFMVAPTVSLDVTLMFVRQIAEADPDAFHVLLWDNAGFHQRPGDPSLPPNVRVLPFPACSPELNPVERLWRLLRDAVGNVVHGTIEAMDDAVSAALKAVRDAPALVRGLVGDGWLRVQANAMWTDFL